MCLLSICISFSFLRTVNSNILLVLYLGYFVFIVELYFYTFWIQILYEVYDLQVFSIILWLVFSLNIDILISVVPLFLFTMNGKEYKICTDTNALQKDRNRSQRNEIWPLSVNYILLSAITGLQDRKLYLPHHISKVLLNSNQNLLSRTQSAVNIPSREQ